MPSGQDFSQCLRDLNDWCDKADEEIIDQISVEREDGVEGEGYAVQHGSHQLSIILFPDKEFGTIFHEFNVLAPMAEQIAIANAAEGIDPQEDPGQIELEADIGPGEQEQAQQQIMGKIEDFSDEDLGKVRSKVTEYLSKPEVAFQLNTTERGGVLGFQVSRKEWMFEEEYGAKELSRGAQSVVSIALPAQKFLMRVFGLESRVINVEAEGSESGNLDSGRGFY